MKSCFHVRSSTHDYLHLIRQRDRENLEIETVEGDIGGGNLSNEDSKDLRYRVQGRSCRDEYCNRAG